MANEVLNWLPLEDLNKDIIEKKVPESSGVYRLSAKEADDNFYVFYVNMADNLRQTLLSHLDEHENVCIEDFVKSGKSCAFRYAVTNDKELMEITVRDLYIKYSPKCNLTVPFRNE